LWKIKKKSRQKNHALLPFSITGCATAPSSAKTATGDPHCHLSLPWIPHIEKKGKKIAYIDILC